MITILLPGSRIVPSCSLQEITIYTDHDHIDVDLTADDTTLLSNRYYSINGTVTITSVNELIEQYLATHLANTTDFYVTASNATDTLTRSVRIMYCDKVPDCPDFSEWLTSNFLSTAPFKRIAPDDTAEIYWYASLTESNQCRLLVKYIDTNGSHQTSDTIFKTLPQLTADRLLSLTVTQPEIASHILSTSGSAPHTIQSFTLRVDDRSITFFVDPSLTKSRRFHFLNCFNIPETITLKCTTTHRIISDRSLATIGRTSVFYDTTNSKQYETQTGPLTIDECNLIEQLLTSHSVRIQWGGSLETSPEFDSLSEILITDFTSELVDEGELNSVKFTWQFSDMPPKINLPASVGIFSTQYNPVFT